MKSYYVHIYTYYTINTTSTLVSWSHEYIWSELLSVHPWIHLLEGHTVSPLTDDVSSRDNAACTISVSMSERVYTTQSPDWMFAEHAATRNKIHTSSNWTFYVVRSRQFRLEFPFPLFTTPCLCSVQVYAQTPLGEGWNTSWLGLKYLFWSPKDNEWRRSNFLWKVAGCCHKKQLSISPGVLKNIFSCDSNFSFHFGSPVGCNNGTTSLWVSQPITHTNVIRNVYYKCQPQDVSVVGKNVCC